MASWHCKWSSALCLSLRNRRWSTLSTNMMKTASAMGFLLILTAVAAAQQGPDFSGTYFLKSFARSDSRNSSVSSKVMVGREITKVAQDSNSVEIVFRSLGQGAFTCKYRLDGSEIQSTDPDGTPTVERAEIKGENLIIRSSIKVGTGALKGIPILRTQKWELSKDLKTLTVREETQVQGMHVQDDLLTVTYIRQ